MPVCSKICELYSLFFFVMDAEFADDFWFEKEFLYKLLERSLLKNFRMVMQLYFKDMLAFICGILGIFFFGVVIFATMH